MAARLAGAYIEYRWNPNATRYDFTLYIYKDCSDNDRLNDFENIRVRRGANGTQIDEFRVDKLPGAPLDVGNICPQQLAQSNCRGGTIPSIEKHIYKGSYRLPAPQRADNWFFYWFNDQQPRSPGTNGTMANASGPNVIYVEAFVDVLQGNAPHLDCVVVKRFPGLLDLASALHVACDLLVYRFAAHHVDKDGDVLEGDVFPRVLPRHLFSRYHIL